VNPLQAVTVLFETVDLLDEWGGPTCEKNANQAHEALCVLMKLVVAHPEYRTFLDPCHSDYLPVITAEEMRDYPGVEYPAAIETLRTANGAGGSEQTNAGGKEK
jgi:hypothetical protein